MWSHQTGRFNWKLGKFFILVGVAENGGVHDVVDGLLLPPFGLYDRAALSGAVGKERMKNRWSLTHLPTGRCIADAHEPWGLALVALAEWLVSEMPGVFDDLKEKQRPGDLAERVRRECCRLGVRFGSSGR